MALIGVFGATAQDAEAAKAEARKYTKALLKGKWEKVIDMTYPELVTANGGAEKMMIQAELFDQTMVQQGFTLKKAELADPLMMFESGEYWTCVIPTKLTFNGPLGNLYSESGLLALQKKGETTWTFVDMAQVEIAQLIEVFPSLNQGIEIPVKRIYQD